MDPLAISSTDLVSLVTAVSTVTNETTTIFREPYVRPFSDEAIIVSAAFLIPMAVFGIIGNVITIIVISKSKSLRSVFNTFILSLCVSDLLSAIVSPLFLYRRTWGFDSWKLPDFFCKFYWGTDMMTSCATSHHILIYSFLRLLSITKPQIFKRITRRLASIIVSSIWLVCFATAFVLFAYWFEAADKDRYSDHVSAKWPACTLKADKLPQFSLYLIVGFGVHIYLPLIGIIICCTWTSIAIWKLRRERKKRASKAGDGTKKKDDAMGRKEKKAVIQLAFIAGSYLIGYVTYSAYMIFSRVTVAVTLHQKQADWTFGMIEYICLRFTECLNPVFYNIASEKMRKETLALFQKCGILRCQKSEEYIAQLRTTEIQSSTVF